MGRDVDRVPFFDAFLSYASADRNRVETLAHQLVASGVDVFLDSWYMAPGQNIPKILLTALRKSHKVVALMTPYYFQSKWTDFELNWNFVETHLAPAGSDSPVIPVILVACDLPKELRTLKHVDLTDAKFKSGCETLTNALSRRDDFAIESYPIPRGAASRYLAEFVANKAERFFAFPADRLHDFMVVYSELVSNAFRHVTKLGNHVDVTITANTFQLVLEVSDDGPGIDLSQYTETSDAPVENEAARLSGLRIASELCDRLSNQMRDGRHVITAVLDREPVHTIRSLEELNPMDESPAWLAAMPGPRFHRYVDPAKSFAYVAVTTGRIDYINADDVTYFLKSFKSFDRVVIDASTIVYLDSSGIGTLVRFLTLVLKHGGTVAIVCTKRVADLMHINRLSDVFKIFLSRSEGLRSILSAS